MFLHAEAMALLDYRHGYNRAERIGTVKSNPMDGGPMNRLAWLQLGLSVLVVILMLEERAERKRFNALLEKLG